MGLGLVRWEDDKSVGDIVPKFFLQEIMGLPAESRDDKRVLLKVGAIQCPWCGVVFIHCIKKALGVMLHENTHNGVVIRCGYSNPKKRLQEHILQHLGGCK
jgi:hypothetical protein